MNQDMLSGKLILRQRFIRIYGSGLLGLGILYLAWSALDKFAPWIDDFDNPLIPLLITIAVITLVPPILGLIIQYCVNPLLGRWNVWSELVRLEGRVVGELSSERQPKIVLVKTGQDEQTIGVLTKQFQNAQKIDVGTVYLPMGPRAKTGYIRIMPINLMEETGWTMREYQLYQFTFGKISPDKLAIQSND